MTPPTGVAGAGAGSIFKTFILRGTVPFLVATSVETASPTIVSLIYNQNLDAGSVPAAGDFTITDHTITGVAIVGATIELTLSTAVIYFDILYVTYTKGVNPIQGDMGGMDAVNLGATLIMNNVAKTGNEQFWYKPTEVGAAVRDGSGAESIYWDMLVGNDTLGAEQNSGVIIQYAVYKITATQANFFYTGCLVGDTFVCAVVKTCDANNKVQRYTGNHLGQGVGTNQPVNQVFDGIDNFMKTAPVATLDQPEFIIIVFKQITWTLNDGIFDGNALNSGRLLQNDSSPKLLPYAGTIVGRISQALDTYCIARVLFNGASSKFIINTGTPVTGNFGVANMGGFTLGSRGTGLAEWSNMQVKEIISLDIAPSNDYETSLYNYIKRKNGL